MSITETNNSKRPAGFRRLLSCKFLMCWYNGKEKNLLEKSSFWEENSMIDMKKALQSIDDVIEKGPYKDT